MSGLAEAAGLACAGSFTFTTALTGSTGLGRSIAGDGDGFGAAALELSKRRLTSSINSWVRSAIPEVVDCGAAV